jgi:hypothetical protein
MRTNEARLRKIEKRMHRDPAQMSQQERDALIDEILGKVGLTYKGLLERFGSTEGILKAIAFHREKRDRIVKGEPPIR